jgi:hypothetical protein
MRLLFLSFLPGIFVQSYKKLALVLLVSLASAQAPAVDAPFAAVDKFIDLLAPHARHYPPQFNSAGQKTAMVKGLKDILATMDEAPPRARLDREFLFRYAFLNSMGHNLDVEGCSDKTMNAYEALLELAPDDKRLKLLPRRLLARSGPVEQPN